MPNAYMTFANEKRKEVMKAHPHMKITEIGKKLGEMWRALSDDEKAKYSPKKNAVAKPKQAQTAAKPEKELKGYMLFVKKNRELVKKENPTLAFTEIGKELGKRWKALSAEEKKKY